jgi:NhaP-type Na+/H+ or K+/H+ antiporter
VAHWLCAVDAIAVPDMQIRGYVQIYAHFVIKYLNVLNSSLAGVFVLTALNNLFSVRQIGMQEQFIMAYGGLRGAVGFSLVVMLDGALVAPRQLFITATLVVILFTVFIQVSYATGVTFVSSRLQQIIIRGFSR